MKKLLFVGIALIALAGSVFAYPSLLGPTGTTQQPTADVAAQGQWSLAADYLFNDYDMIPVRFIYGAGNGLEIGAGYSFADDTDAWTVNAKYLTPLTLLDANWAIGGVYMDFNDWDENAWQFYFVGSKMITEGGNGAPAIKGNLGVNYTDFDGDNAVRFFAGIEAIINETTCVGIDFQTKDSSIDDSALWNIYARHKFTENIAGEIGYGNGALMGMDDEDLFAGISYTAASF